MAEVVAVGVGAGPVSFALITKAALLLLWFGSQRWPVVPSGVHWPTVIEPLASATTVSIFSWNG